jgi:hypothetical protein
MYFTDVVMNGRILNHTENVHYVSTVLGAVFMNSTREIAKWPDAYLCTVTLHENIALHLFASLF